MKLVIVGGGTTVKLVALVAVPSTVVTVIGCGPLAAPVGTSTTTIVGADEITVAAVPPNFTVGALVLTFNVVPEILTAAPGVPLLPRSS